MLETTHVPTTQREKPEPTGKIAWPRKAEVFGVDCSITTYQEVIDCVLEAAGERIPAIVSLHPVHGLITSSGNPELRDAVNGFQIVAPDGQPVRWALNLLHRARLRERVYGPELTLRLCRAAAEQGVPIYLYGSTPEVVGKLRDNMIGLFPRLQVAGAEAPPFRPLTPAEDAEMVRRVNESGAGILFIGLGCPKQDYFAFEHRHTIQSVQICVGAAFDFHAGNKKMAPGWMQRRGLEWLYRLIHEPRRLWRRYLVTNSVYLGKLVMALPRRYVFPRKQQQETEWASVTNR